jgi:hypothetical protein
MNMADLQEFIEQDGEPELCQCGKHYIGAPCPEEEATLRYDHL